MSVKAVRNTPHGKVLLVGMGDGNAAKMLEDDPLWVMTGELQLPRALLIVGYKHHNGDIGVPNVYLQAAKQFQLPLLVVGVEAEQLQPGVKTVWAANDAQPLPAIDCCLELMRDTDEQTMFQRIRGSVGPDCSLQVQGFAPGEFQPFRDN